VDAFSEHFSSIILRHIDISGAITGDILDAVGLLAVIGSWLTRVGPELREYNELRKAERSELPDKPKLLKKSNSREAAQPVEAVSKTPIEKVSPATKEYLDRLAAEQESDNAKPAVSE
jgi:hypothetical protein